MRKDYVEPDDFEYEPTPHDEVLKRAQAHQSSATGTEGSRNKTGGRMMRSDKDGEGRRLEPAAGD